ncbi:hypothetical protein [Agrobacterium vitis]|uniref:hypothetical protein n=1 Tax=Agrobacterium vitis TaxID=373 RepID=UPI0012EA83E9|nr:hypothetical protein [Agrobacterium vitis]MUO86757.1 hypothetical protein [Agrobacterium vitis]
MSSSETLLPTPLNGDSLTIVLDEDRQRDAGETVETTSTAPVGCWAGEAIEPKSDEKTRVDRAETVPTGCWADDGDEKQAEIREDGSLSVTALSGSSNNSPKEPKTAADAIKSRRDFEAFLRTNGFSRAAAKAIAANGWASIGEHETGGEPDPEEITPEQAETLLNLFKI